MNKDSTASSFIIANELPERSQASQNSDYLINYYSEQEIQGLKTAGFGSRVFEEQSEVRQYAEVDKTHNDSELTKLAFAMSRDDSGQDYMNSKQPDQAHFIDRKYLQDIKRQLVTPVSPLYSSGNFNQQQFIFGNDSSVVLQKGKLDQPEILVNEPSAFSNHHRSMSSHQTTESPKTMFQVPPPPQKVLHPVLMQSISRHSNGTVSTLGSHRSNRQAFQSEIPLNDNHEN